MTIPGFDAAQARYDSMLPVDPVFAKCPDHDGSMEDCWDEHDDPSDLNERLIAEESDAFFEAQAEARAEARAEREADPDYWMD